MGGLCFRCWEKPNYFGDVSKPFQTSHSLLFFTLPFHFQKDSTMSSSLPTRLMPSSSSKSEASSNMSLPLFPDAGHDSLINFLSSKDSSSLPKSITHASLGHDSSSSPSHGQPLIQNLSSHSSSVRHHRYESRSSHESTSAADQRSSKQPGRSPDYHQHSSDESNRSMRYPSSFSSSVKHHHYEARKMVHDEAKNENHKGFRVNEDETKQMMDSSNNHERAYEKCNPPNNHVTNKYMDSFDPVPKNDYHTYRPTNIGNFGDDDSTIPTTGTFDSTLTIEPHEIYHAFGVPPSNINTYKMNANTNHQNHAFRTMGSCKVRPPQNITIADELRKQRGREENNVPFEAPIHVLHSRDQNVVPNASYVQKQESSPYHHVFKHAGGMSASKGSAYNPNHGSDMYDSYEHPSVFTRRSGETPLTVPCSETTRGSTHNGSFMTNAHSVRVVHHHDPLGSGSKSFHTIPSAHSCCESRQHEDDANIDRVRRLANERPARMQKMPHLEQTNFYESSQERTFHDVPVPSSSYSSGVRTPIRCNKNNFSAATPNDDNKVKENDRLVILQEIRMVMDMKQKAKMMEEQEEAQLLSRHLHILNEELERLSIGHGTMPKANSLSAPMEKDATLPAPVAPNLVQEKTNVQKVSELDHTTKFDTIKIRAPASLKAGYEFSANVNGRVIKASVVSYFIPIQNVACY